MARIAFTSGLLFSITLIFPTGTVAQTSADWEFIIRHHQTCRPPAIEIHDHTLSATSEAGLLAIGSIKLYQTVISSQDISACNFTPSCSGFALAAIRKGGLIRGSLISGDRLMRCHWFSKSQGKENIFRYDGFKLSGKIYDPAEKYLNFGKDE